ncbi:hypothetical protein ZHAS_00020214 [Anopheles sinensis]|uniref:Uncharacterized protein n=1 Tax=Anopheles sinensis TaxID=74873 RepID=A0A084WP89_ANOSI|nr:hypothetical protein ZHAS_00020214 [Anopheles sinensis]
MWKTNEKQQTANEVLRVLGALTARAHVCCGGKTGSPDWRLASSSVVASDRETRSMETDATRGNGVPAQPHQAAVRGRV